MKREFLQIVEKNNSLHSVIHSFSESMQFLELLVKLSGESTGVVARCYQDGLWCQFTGRDFVKHVSQSQIAWSKCFQKEQNIQSLLFFGQNSYGNFVSILGALLAGVNVVLLPDSVGDSVLLWAREEFAIGAVASESSALLKAFEGLPVFDLSVGGWVSEGNSVFEECFPLQWFRLFQSPEEVQNMKLASAINLSESKYSSGEQKSQPVEANTKLQDSKDYWNENLKFWKQRKVGQLSFVSYGSDGFQKPETISLDEFQTTARNFLSVFSYPPKDVWKTMEMLPLAHPFTITSFFSTLWRNGVLGFLNSGASWETNFRILRPSILFAGERELKTLVTHVEEMSALPSFRSRQKLGSLVESTRSWLEGGRALKLPEIAFDSLSQVVRFGSRLVVGNHFIQEALGELKCVVHGLSALKQEHAKHLEKLGLKLVETYGVTAACGILSSNSFQTPHSQVIGSPLAHVQFRLGAHSLLEYRISHGKLDIESGIGSSNVTLSEFKVKNTSTSNSGNSTSTLSLLQNSQNSSQNSSRWPNHSQWEETGDIAQMTPFGYAIIGRRKHLFFTQGGLVISPGQIEKNLKQNSLVAEACLIGDKMPFLAVLIELSPEGEAKKRDNAELLESEIEAWLSVVNESLPRSATIKKFQLLETPFSLAKGEKLSNGLLNRFVILVSRRIEIANLYSSL